MQLPLLYGDMITPCVRAVNCFDIFVLKGLFGYTTPTNDNLSVRGKKALESLDIMFDLIYGGKDA